MRRVVAAVLSALIAVLLATPVVNAETTVSRDSQAAYSSYVALGDSYTSGTLIPNQVNLPCTRSDRNYPSLVTQAIQPAEFTDASCGGATTDDMTRPQWGIANRPQFDALRPDTDLVTVGIGGNDVPFIEVVATCAALSVTNPKAAPCQDHYNASGTDGLVEKVRAVGPKVAGVLEGIKQRSPEAHVALVGYPSLLPESGDSCWPIVPIAAGDAPYLRDITKLLNQVLAEQAAAHGVTYVDTYTSSVGHDMCAPRGERWVEGILLGSPAAPVHPNALGAENQAEQVLATLGAQ
ncbi:SGNH/GDSL hydrolase family protein [Prauserella cavernicola]|uniref:SGNH/GDSL hydrolase family protein n=1 Tax=Prauserella cavernicola TaxID=2800127 RepID=A0A934V663_9PSEU|nr:SGNH/GDSL hydrolase family protein [Prauserella cavernicola]MBK1785353.1 SGNH/GDSL hydrolase family protein [Prauserella cavernicola]